MKKFISVLVLVCIMASMFTLSAFAATGNYEVTVGSDTITGTDWDVVKADIDAKLAVDNTLDVTVKFSGTVEMSMGSSTTPMNFFATTGKVSFVGTDGAIFRTIGPGEIAVTQPGGLYFSNLTVQDDCTYGNGAWEHMYFDVVGYASFSGVVFGVGDAPKVCGGTVDFSNCDFAGGNNGSASEYGLWVANGTANVNGCRFTGTRAIKAHNEYGSSTVGLNVANSSFSVTDKAAVELDVHSSMTVSGISLNNNTYNGCDIINKEGNFSDNSITITPYPFVLDITSAELKVKKTVQLKASLEGILVNENAEFDATKVVWSSSDEKIATVDENGLVTAVAPGNVTITATYDDGAVRTATCEVKVIAVANPYGVPSTADNSNMPLWAVLFIGFAAVALLTGKKRRA